MSLETAEREYLKYLQNKVKQNKQAAAAEARAAAAQAVAAVPPTTPVDEEPVSKKRGRKPKASVSPEDAEAMRLVVESIRP